MKRIALRALGASFLLVAIGLSVNCTLIAKSDLKAGVGQKCAGDDECQGGVCVSGLCSAACTTTPDCPSPSICVAGKCRIGCTGDPACGGGNICVSNACRAGCRTFADCGSTQICDTTTFLCREGCIDDTGDRGCPTSQICDTATTTCIPGCRDDAAGTVKGCGSGEICKKPDLKCVPGCHDDKGCGAGFICEGSACRTGCRGDDPTKTDKVCAAGSYCDTASTTCLASLRVCAILPGPTNGTDAWSTANKLGLDQAATSLPYVKFGDKPYVLKESIRKADDVKKEIAACAAAGADVIYTASQTATDEALVDAPTFPGVKFVLAGARKNNTLPNVGAYRAKGEQPWYAAGRIAARVAQTKGNKCIGMILPVPSKQIVSETNAFVRGARYQGGAAMKVVIRWMGATKDLAATPNYSYTASTYSFTPAADGTLYREQLLAAQLADLGCSVVMHRTETQRSVAIIESRLNTAVKTSLGYPLFSMASDLQFACKDSLTSTGTWFDTCLGSIYYNGGPFDARIFGQIMPPPAGTGTWKADVVNESFTVDAKGLLKFALSPAETITGVESTAADAYLNEAADGIWPDYVFTGTTTNPLTFNGQRDGDKDGFPDTQTIGIGLPIAAEEVDRMCWFVDGTYEMPSCAAPGCNGTYASLIKAMVPYGPPVSGQVTTMSDTTGDKAKYGDVIQFVKSLGALGLPADPTKVMNCALN
jgi:basic membrane lipoprotein Med (substrate-binding protein (PBP1-ABC) superfamily)